MFSSSRSFPKMQCESKSWIKLSKFLFKKISQENDDISALIKQPLTINKSIQVKCQELDLLETQTVIYLLPILIITITWLPRISVSLKSIKITHLTPTLNISHLMFLHLIQLSKWVLIMISQEPPLVRRKQTRTKGKSHMPSLQTT